MSKILVAYFSASGTTAKVAEKVAKATGGDLFEIVPKQRYSEADLDWRNAKSRSSVEMKDKKFRPAVSSKVADMSAYDTIYIGFPIWWYVAPTIINTFLEQYDLSGKTVNVFVCHGGSRASSTLSTIRSLQPSASVSDNVLTLYWTDIPNAPTLVNDWVGS